MTLRYLEAIWNFSTTFFRGSDTSNGEESVGAGKEGVESGLDAGSMSKTDLGRA